MVREPCNPDPEFQNYAIKISFSDGHNSGIYSWDYLIDLATNFEQNWNDYLRRLLRKRGRETLFLSMQYPIKSRVIGHVL